MKDDLMADRQDPMQTVLRRYPGQHLFPFVVRAEGIHVYLENGQEIMDVTAGYSGCTAVGYSHPEVLSAIRDQLDKFSYISALGWSNRQVWELADLLIDQAPTGLDRVFFSGCSGSEAIEAAMKLSYQAMYDSGEQQRTWYISRDQSFHGITAQANAVTTIPIYDFFKPICPSRVAHIPQHNPYSLRKDGETLEEYSRRSASYLEHKILEIGPDKVCAFVGETMLGQLVGNVPPAINYWRHIREICDKYGVHLILDEVYCGLGRSGEVYCCAWDNVVPDFVCVGKMLSAGYGPISAVITNSSIEEIIVNGQGRVMLGSTYEAHPLAVAAAVAVQSIVSSSDLLDHIKTSGDYMRATIEAELGGHPFFSNVRGRGLLTSFEYNCSNRDLFNERLEHTMLNDHGILLSAKFHRTNFNPPNIVTREQIDFILDTYIQAFSELASSWQDN